MLFVVAWVVWIAIQISPPEMVLPAAYEAAAQGRARNSSGTIGTAQAPVQAQVAVQAAADAPAVSGLSTGAVPAETAAPAPVASAEPPVNLEKLRRAESIETPIPERPRRAARPATDPKQ